MFRFFYNLRVVSFLLVFVVIFSLNCSDTSQNPIVGNDNDITPPVKPTGLTLPAVGNGEISIKWNVNSESDLASYRLYRAENDDVIENYELIYDSSAVSYIDAILDYTTIYFYRVRAVDLSGNASDYSDPVEGQPFNTHAPSIPENLQVVAQNLGSTIFDISWNSNSESDLKGYKIYRGTEFNFPKDQTTLIDSTTEIAYADINVVIDSVYYYKVSAYDLGDKESLTTDPESDVALSPPTIVAPLENAEVSSTPTFTWTKVNNALQYKLFVQTSSQGGEIWVTTLENSVNSIQYAGTTELVVGTTYYWKVATITKDANRLNSITNTFKFKIK